MNYLYLLVCTEPSTKNLSKTRNTLEINDIPNPNSLMMRIDGLWGQVRSGEEFQLQYVLVPFKLVFRKFGIWANQVFTLGGGVNKRGGQFGAGVLRDHLGTWTFP